MSKIKSILSSLSAVIISFPLMLYCSDVIQLNRASGDWPVWPLALRASSPEMYEKYISTDSGVEYFSAPTYSNWSSATEAQYDISIVPFNTSTNSYLPYFNNNDQISDEDTPRLDCLNGGGQGQVVWQDERDKTTMNCSWNVTDNATGKVLVPGVNSDYTLVTQYVDVGLDQTSESLHDTHVINAFKIKLNRNKITDSGAIGFNQMGYWFNRPVTINYHYDWTGDISDDVDYYHREMNLSYKFALRQNVVQDEILGVNGGTNVSNWTIDGTVAKSYSISDPQNMNTLDTYTRELLIPTRITAISDYFLSASEDLLTSCNKLTEIPRTNGIKYSIGNGAFANRPIQTLKIPSCTSIGINSFRIAIGTPALTSVICQELLHISAEAFMGQTKLTYFLAPKLTTIDSSAFANCSNLTTMIVPALATYPSDGSAFSGTKLQKIRIGAPNGTPLQYNGLLQQTPIVSSNIGVSNFNISIPAANAETDSTKAGWASSYYNPIFGWTGASTASGHNLSFFFTTYN